MNDRQKKIDQLVKLAVEAELDGLDFLASFDYDQLSDGSNGIGPAWAGETVRARVTEHLSIFEPAALIHDMRNSVSDGTRGAFEAANLEFLANCLKLADAAYPWYSWKRYRARAAAYAMFAFVAGPGGWLAWLECFNKNNQTTNERKN